MARAAGDIGRAAHGATGGSSEGRGGVQSITRALVILDALAGHDDGLSLTALSRSVGLPPSSAHRLLTTLQRSRFVRFEPASMSWRVGVQAFIVGAAFARSREVTPIAMPFMRQLMEKTGETVNLYVPNNGQAVCIAQVQSRQAISAISRPGGALPLYRSAAGKAMLATLAKGEVEEALAKYASRGERSEPPESCASSIPNLEGCGRAATRSTMRRSPLGSGASPPRSWTRMARRMRRYRLRVRRSGSPTTACRGLPNWSSRRATRSPELSAARIG